MRQGIVHQVTQQFVQQCRFAAQPHRLVGFQRQGHAARMGQRRHGHAQFAGQLAQIQQLRAAFGNRPGAVLDARQGQQLISQMGQSISALGRGFQGIAPCGRVFGAQSQLQAGLECCQWSAQFVGRIGDKLRLPLELPAQALGEVVE